MRFAVIGKFKINLNKFKRGLAYDMRIFGGGFGRFGFGLGCLKLI